MQPKEPLNRKAKLYNSRTIRTESPDPSLRNGILNASEFINSREFEIRAFEQSQLNTKSASSSRIFQSLPRTLRRRTASHNVKRIPKRLRARAVREMQASGPSAKSKKRTTERELYKLRIMKKNIQLAAKLHLMGAQVAAEGSIKERFRSLNKQWKVVKKEDKPRRETFNGCCDRVGINLLCEKPFGGIKYGTRQREFTWTPNHIWHAKRFHMIKKWGWHIPYSPNQKCFRSTSRASKDQALLFDTSYYSHIVIDCVNDENVKLALNEFTRYCGKLPDWLKDGKKVYNGWLYLKGRRSAMISLCHNPAHFNLLVRVHPSDFSDCFKAFADWALNGSKLADEVKVYDCRYAIGSLEVRGPLALNCLSKVLHPMRGRVLSNEWKLFGQSSDLNLIESGHMFAFHARDPRYWKKPIQPPSIEGDIKKYLVEKTKEDATELIAVEAQNVEVEDLSSDSKALSALLLHQKRHELYIGCLPLKELEKERRIGSNKSNVILKDYGFPILVYKLENGSWSVNMPWFWIQPLWGMLTKVNGLKIAGYRQMHQINSEKLQPTYPYDYPFTFSGYKEHQLNITSNIMAHEKLPSSKKISFEKNEGQVQPGCDWFFLRKWVFGLQLLNDKLSQLNKSNNQIPANPLNLFGEFDAENNRILRTAEDLALIIDSTRTQGKDQIPIELLDFLNPTHKSFMNGTFKPDISKFPSLPVIQISLQPVKGGLIKDNARVYCNENVQDLRNLIGFVSTSSYNISLGNPSGIAIISANFKDLKRVFVRNLNGSIGHAYKVTAL